MTNHLDRKVTTFVGIRTLARVTGLSLQWLDDEARAGRLPVLVAGRRRLFNIDAVEDALLERARRAPTPAAPEPAPGAVQYSAPVEPGKVGR